VPPYASSAEVAGIGVTRDTAVALVRLDNPAVHNALTLEMWRELERVITALREDPEVLVIVLHGAGEHFSTGADIGDLPDDADDFHAVHLAVEHAIATSPTPIIAAIEGYCVGGGCELAVACDLRFAAPTATFGITASRLGLVYPLVPTRRLRDLVGPSAARRLLYGGELFDAEWALRVGLVDEIVSGDVVAWAWDYARLLAGRSQASIVAAKRFTADVRVAERAAVPTDAAADYAEGVSAFRERRPPQFPSGTRPSSRR
jgi:enoyl-CoA hydratase/carnithine racemase